MRHAFASLAPSLLLVSCAPDETDASDVDQSQEAFPSDPAATPLDALPDDGRQGPGPPGAADDGHRPREGDLPPPPPPDGDRAASIDGTDGAPEALTDPDGAPIDHCMALYGLVERPIVDGRIEPGMYLEPVAVEGWLGGQPRDGHLVRFAAAWHPDGLYFFVVVSDPDRNPASLSMPVWQGDAVEIYVDHDAVPAVPGSYDEVGAKQLIVAAPVADDRSGIRADVYVPDGYEDHWQEDNWVSVPTRDGYVVEAFVVAEDLGLGEMALGPGARIGFDLAHDVSCPPGEVGFAGNRQGQYFHRVAEPFLGEYEDYPFSNSGVFCTPTLLEPGR